MTQDRIEGAVGNWDSRQWRRVIATYHRPSHARSIMELLITLAGFMVSWAAIYLGLTAGYALAWLMIIPAAAFLVRLFMIQHDCSHHAFFRPARVNDWVGRVIGVITLTPHDFWRYTHIMHHASSGNLDRSELGAITTLTVAEYQAMPRGKRLKYRLYRHPLVMLVIGPAYLFLLDHRLPVGAMRGGRMPWLSTMGTNAAIALTAGSLMSVTGIGTFLMIQLPITVLAASIGVWLFYVQHQFETTYWERDPNWDQPEAALEGSSHLDLPPVLRWFTANIGIHHVHHLCSRVPFYRLPEILRNYPELKGVNRITLKQSLALIRVTLWDENQRRLVTFRQARQRSTTASAAVA
jgi:omega-6 fatty acid desaturase (delta-12 desaturase)